MLGSAWMDLHDIVERDEREAEKRKVANSSPPSTSSAGTKRKADDSAGLKPSPRRGPAVKRARKEPSPDWPDSPSPSVKGKEKAIDSEDVAMADDDDDDLTDLEDEYASALVDK